MKNIQIDIDDKDILTVKVDLQRDVSWSRSNRSITIGTSEGNVLLWRAGEPHPNNVKLNISVFRALTDEEKRELAEAKKKARGY